MDKLAICNAALMRCGTEPILVGELTVPTSKRGLAVVGQYETTLKELLNDSPWNFTIKKKKVTIQSVAITSWSFNGTTVRLVVPSGHGFVAEDVISVAGLLTGSYPANTDGVKIDSVTATSITYTAINTPADPYITNLLSYASKFDNAAWTKTACSITANAATAPDGTLTADTFVDTAALVAHYMDQTLTKAATSLDYTVSVYVKKVNHRYVGLQLGAGGATNSVIARFDIDTETFGTLENNGTFTNASASYEALDNGWYRLSLSGTTGTETALNMRIVASASLSADNYLGTANARFYVWGAQLERDALDTSTVTAATAYVKASTLFGYKYRYALPSDCIRVLELEDKVPYRVESTGIMCDEDAYIQVKYSYYNNTPTTYNGSFVKALVLKLAEDISYLLVQSAALQGAITTEAERYLRKARSMNSQEGTPESRYPEEYTAGIRR